IAILSECSKRSCTPFRRDKFMHRIKRLSRAVIFGICMWTLAGATATGQGTRADYERANKLGELTRNKVFKSGVRPHWLAGNSRFWYQNDLADEVREFILVDAAQGKREPAFDHARLAAALSKQTGKDIKPTHLPITSLETVENTDAIRFNAEGKTW